jgi:hypothetical protein
MIELSDGVLGMRENVRLGELLDYPGFWKLNAYRDDGKLLWMAVRKPDGTYWSVAAEHFGPPGGGTLRVELGEEITSEEKVLRYETMYVAAQERICRCGHKCQDHNARISRCYGDDERGLPVVEEGQPYPLAPECECKQFVPRE